MSKADPKNVKQPAGSTVHDDIPPVHVLEAAEQQDRKETEDLLAGFDRPGRGPKSAPRERDFVDYYAKKPGAGAGAGSGSGRAAAGVGAVDAGAAPPVRAKQRDVSTVIVRRKDDGAPAWLVWGGVAALMLLLGGGVAYVATEDEHPKTAASATAAPSAASAATTLTSATTVKPTAADETLPPPAPPSASASGAPVEPATARVEPSAAVAPRGSAKREPRVTPSGAETAAGTATESAPPPRAINTAAPAKSAPREDFIRDMK